MQGWSDLGWAGGAGSRYMLWQDRKTILTSQINFMGYLVLLGIAGLWLRAALWPDAYRYPELVEGGSWLYYLIVVDTVFLAWRLALRAYYVWSLYGLGQAVLSAPRQVVGNVINWMAGCRALYLGVRRLATGKPIGWDKTEHVFPAQEQLRAFHRRLGDLLLEKRFVSVDDLEEGLRRKRGSGKLLGEVLVEMGAINGEQLREVLDEQSRD